MLLQNDPFRDVDAWFDRMTGRASNGQQWAMPMDAYKRGNDVWVHLDLPGVAADSLEIDIERNVLTVVAQRSWQREDGDQVYLAERHRGTFRRQVHLGDGLDADRIEADYHDGVLTIRIPVAELAQPRKISINTGARAIDTSSSDDTTLQPENEPASG
jgi:HSP20 family protein